MPYKRNKEDRKKRPKKKRIYRYTGSGITPWILQSGSWNDAGIWKDSSNWID